MKTIDQLLKSIESNIEGYNTIRQRLINDRLELAKLSPFKIGDELVVNGWSHKGKTIVVDEIIASDRPCELFKTDLFSPVKCFLALGHVKLKDGSLGKHRGSFSVGIGQQ